MKSQKSVLRFVASPLSPALALVVGAGLLALPSAQAQDSRARRGGGGFNPPRNAGGLNPNPVPPATFRPFNNGQSQPFNTGRSQPFNSGQSQPFNSINAPYGFNGYQLPGGSRMYTPNYGYGPNGYYRNGYNGANNPNRYNRPNPGLGYNYNSPSRFYSPNFYNSLPYYPPGGYGNLHSGFRYSNGVYGRSSFSIFASFGNYFPGGQVYYPYYATAYTPYATCLSPYTYYYGAFPPYISSTYIYSTPPPVVYVPVPSYSGDTFQGWRNDDVDDYYLNGSRGNDDSEYQIGEQTRDLNRQRAEIAQEREDLARERAALQRDKEAVNAEQDSAAQTATSQAVGVALADIRRAWTERDVENIAKHVQSSGKIAVYLRGKYQYSLTASDYLDLTRDAFRATTTVRFDLDKAQRRENGVYTVTGRHVYKDKKGDEKTVYVSYVLEKIGDNYVITQIGTAPEKVEK